MHICQIKNGTRTDCGRFIGKEADKLNRYKRAHSPQLAAGLASESKMSKLPYREDSLQLAAGYSSIVDFYLPITVHGSLFPIVFFNILFSILYS